MELLDKIVEVLGEDKMTLAEYQEILEAGFAEASVGIIPPTADQVLIGDNERSRLKDIRVLFFVGVNDGLIPRHDAGGGILSEYDREELERAIVGAIGDLDLYMLPDARGVKSLYQYLAGDTEEKRQRMREEMLSTTADDFRAFAGIMAEAKTHGAVSVIGGSRALEEGTRLGWKCENLF